MTTTKGAPAMAELYYSLTSKKRIFHLAACRYRRRIAVDSLVILDDFSQAADRGLLPCKCCLRVLQRYRSESSQIHRFCRENGILPNCAKPPCTSSPPVTAGGSPRITGAAAWHCIIETHSFAFVRRQARSRDFIFSPSIAIRSCLIWNISFRTIASKSCSVKRSNSRLTSPERKSAAKSILKTAQERIRSSAFTT